MNEERIGIKKGLMYNIIRLLLLRFLLKSVGYGLFRGRIKYINHIEFNEAAINSFRSYLLHSHNGLTVFEELEIKKFVDNKWNGSASHFEQIAKMEPN